MSKSVKTVEFKVGPSKLAPTAKDWIQSRDTPTADREGGVTPFRAPEAKPDAVPKEKMSRLTLDVSESLHRRIKIACAERGQSIADVMREHLEREFPVKS